MAKKQLIMEEALKLFAEKGFELTSVQQITDACGISKGAFYLSFKSKDELISSMVDHFMRQLIIQVDQVVRDVENEEEILYKFYTTIFTSFYKHADFAKFFVKEQMKSFDEELFLKSQMYIAEMDKTILSMIEKLYGDAIEETKYDLIYTINGLVKAYSHLFVFYNFPLDADALAKSLVEKTNILAKHMTKPFLTGELPLVNESLVNGKVSKEYLLEVIEQNIREVEGKIEKESLHLLKEELSSPTLSPAIVKGLIHNIEKEPVCQWMAYVLEDYFGFTDNVKE